LKAAIGTAELLAPADPQPVEWVNQHSQSALLLLCEHAGKAVPACLNNLGLSKQQLNEHIGWDIGAKQLALRLAERMQAPLILQRYSRLVIDCNRPPGSPGSIPFESDGTAIPANHNLSEFARQTRVSDIFTPLDNAITEGLNAHPRLAVFSLHSFTPQLQSEHRPWHAGFLNRKNKSTGKRFVSYFNQQRPDLTVAINEPYLIEDETDWFIPQHAEPNDLIHGLIEVRNDQLRDEAGIDQWAELLAGAIQFIMEES